MNTYDIDTLVQINGSFVVSGSTTPIDPTDVNLFVQSPTGVTTEYTYPTDITRSGAGNYNAQVTLDEAGTWTYKWQGTGAAEVSSPDRTMIVSQTIFSPPL